MSAMTFRKGDRVVIAAVGSAMSREEAETFVGEVGTVQQSRYGGTVAIVALDDRRRISIYQRDLRPYVPGGDFSLMSDAKVRRVVNLTSDVSERGRGARAELARRGLTEVA